MCTLFQGAEWVHGPDGTLFARYKGTKQDVQPSLSALWLAFPLFVARALSERKAEHAIRGRVREWPGPPSVFSYVRIADQRQGYA